MKIVCIQLKNAIHKECCFRLDFENYENHKIDCLPLRHLFYGYIKKIVYLVTISILCSYCNNIYGNNEDNVSVFNTEPTLSAPSSIDLILWKPIILSMLQNVFFFDCIESNSVLLVNMVKNNTNGILQANNITDMLIKCIIKNTTKYNVIEIKKLYSVYRELGVFPEDNGNTYSFSMKIANYLKADYILYSIAYGDAEKPILELQLISVKTGEILRVVNSTA